MYEQEKTRRTTYDREQEQVIDLDSTGDQEQQEIHFPNDYEKNNEEKDKEQSTFITHRIFLATLKRFCSRGFLMQRIEFPRE